MNFKISTIVGNNAKSVWEKFDHRLFEALIPPFPPMKLLRFDGSMKGNEVHVLLFNRFLWEAIITHQDENEKGFVFVDEGKKLPPLIKRWKHTHHINIINEKQTEIIDDIEFEMSNFLLTLIFYPIWYFTFWMRKSVYKTFFLD